MEKYTVGSIILICLSLIRFIFNGIAFTDGFNLRILLFIFLFAVSVLGMLFSKRWSYLLVAGTAISEVSIIAVTLDPSFQLGAFVINGFIVGFAVWMFYNMEKIKSPRRR